VPAATDFSCPSSVASDFDGMEWTPGSGDISGVRAPIEMRFDGLVCGGGPEEAFASSWIAIESSAGNSITQIGFLHFFNSVLGTGEFCRVWAIDGGAAHTYGCNQQTNHTIVYFEIVRFTDPSTHAILYDILDCGTAGGYGNCASENSTQGAYSSAFSPLPQRRITASQRVPSGSWAQLRTRRSSGHPASQSRARLALARGRPGATTAR